VCHWDSLELDRHDFLHSPGDGGNSAKKLTRESWCLLQRLSDW
jgi:hypothetical protein